MTSAANFTAKTAYLLVTHGSRDPRSQAGAEQLASQLRDRFGLNQQVGPEVMPGFTPEATPGITPAVAAIATGVLELGPAPLHCQIEEFAREVAPCGATSIKLLPLFLLPGIHVREDLPEELALAQAALAQQADLAGIALELLPHLGAEAALLPVLRAQQAALLQQLNQLCKPVPEPMLVGAGEAAVSGTASPNLPVNGDQQPLTIGDVDWVLLAHGSRRTKAVGAITDLAHAIGARPTYWVGSPNLTDCVEVQRSRGKEHQPRPLGCLSYFLFEGGITDRLALQLKAAEAAGPTILSAPLGAFPALTDVVAEAMVRSLAE